MRISTIFILHMALCTILLFGCVSGNFSASELGEGVHADPKSELANPKLISTKATKNGYEERVYVDSGKNIEIKIIYKITDGIKKCIVNVDRDGKPICVGFLSSGEPRIRSVDFDGISGSAEFRDKEAFISGMRRGIFSLKGPKDVEFSLICGPDLRLRPMTAEELKERFTIGVIEQY